MFGCCVTGRLLQTNLVQVDETHAYFELMNASTINHVCVFLLGTGLFFLALLHCKLNSTPLLVVPFPDGFGASVHLFWPGKGFQLFGMFVFLISVFFFTSNPPKLPFHRLSNDKPSAIFRLQRTFSSSSASTAQNRFSSYSTEPNVSQDITAILGLSIEPLPQIQYQMTALADSNAALALSKTNFVRAVSVQEPNR